jgi:hypothetical protein
MTRVLPARFGTLGTMLLGVGIACGSVADGLFARGEILNNYLSGSWIDLGWQAEALCYVVAAVAVVRGLDDRPDWRRTTAPPPPLGTALIAAAAVAAAALVTVAGVGWAATVAALVLGAAALGRLVLLAAGPRAPAAPAGVEFSARNGPLAFQDELAGLLARASWFERPFALVLVSADDAREPDEALGSELGSRFARVLHEGDSAFRLRYASYALLLPETTPAEAAALAAALRSQPGHRLTVGVAEAVPGDEVETIIARARSGQTGLEAPAPEGL